MRTLVVLTVLAVSLAGCTEPPPQQAPPAASDPGDGAGASPAGTIPLGDLTATPAGAESPEAPPPNTATPPPAAGNDSAPPDAAAPAQVAAAPPNDTASPGGSDPSAPPSSPPPPAPRADPVPKLRVGDSWRFVGQNLSGSSFTEEEHVLGTGQVGGVLTYTLESKVTGVTHTANVTRSGLNSINETGFVLELLRFPMTAGLNWTFGWEQAEAYEGHNDTPGGVLHESLRGAVEVVGLESKATLAGRFDAWHVRANLTHAVGGMSSWMALDYWFAPTARTIVRLDTRTDQGREAWSELLGMTLGK